MEHTEAVVSFLSLTFVFSDGDDDDEDESVVLINFARVIHEEEEEEEKEEEEANNNQQHNNAKVPKVAPTDRLLRMTACYLNNSSFATQYPKLSI